MQIIVVKTNNVVVKTSNKFSWQLNIDYNNLLNYDNVILIFIAINYDNLVNLVIFQNRKKRIILFLQVLIIVDFVNSLRKRSR